MVQDIFLDIWNRRAELNITGDLEAYLAVSMKFKVINAQARLKRSRDFQQYLVYHQTKQDNSTEEWLGFHELKERLSLLVSKLPERCRITYQLSKELGFSQREIAAQLEISEKAVEANLSRAMKSLRLVINQLRMFSFLFY
jgi:RNA polymerase sigma factor (sigma-70 family)